MQENHYLVPLHREGFKKDLQHHIVAYTADDAEYWFVDVKDRLLDINNWNKYCQAMSAEFRLTDGHGLGVGRHARKGDLVRVDMREQGAKHLGGFEWLCIEAIEYDDYPDLSMETFAIRARAAQSPLDKKDGNEVCDSDTTFTFVIERRGAKLSSSFHCRKESAYTGISGLLELPDTEWLSLVKKLLG